MNSSWRSEWYALAAQIDGLLEAARMYYTTQVRETGDTTPRTKVLVPHSGRIFAHLKEYQRRAEGSLPEKAAQRLADFIAESEGLFLTGARDTGGHIQHRLTALASLRAEIDYLLADFGATARRLTERAFLHLQRSIVVDQAVRDRWSAAFNDGEVACEKLGAVHLLQHGIWAFKAHAPGERTDLVYQDPLRDLTQVDEAAEVLVLTEWKVVKKAGELREKISQAQHQAQRYGSGVLAGIELGDPRYLVIVSKKVLELPGDQEVEGVTYRQIGIAVDPDTPSYGAGKAR